MGSRLFGGRGRLTSAAHLRKAIELIIKAHSAGAGLVRACSDIGISLRTLKRWRKACLGEGDGRDRRKGNPRQVSHRLNEEKHEHVLLICNQTDYASLPLGQIVPALADQGIYIGSKSSFYRVLHARGQVLPARTSKTTTGTKTNATAQGYRSDKHWSWDITYLPTTVRGVWLHLYLVIDAWIRKIVAWDVAKERDPAIAANLVSRVA